MGLVEAWGSGIKRIINAAKEYGVPEPKFQEFDNMFRVELFRNNSMAGSEKKAGEDSEIIMGYELSDTQKKVMNILFYEYKRFPNLYSSYSAPWYTEALLYSAASFAVIIVCIILRVLIRHKMDKK